MPTLSYPSLYQINTRVWLTELSQKLGRRATLDDVPDSELDRLAKLGFEWVWFLSVWQTGPAGQKVSRSNPEWRKEFQETLPDLREEDIGGSGFAIAGYVTHTALGGDQALARLRKRMKDRKLRLMLDFVPNHTALDHPWVEEHVDYYMPGMELDLARAPKNYIWVKRKGGDRLLAYGRDPYFPGWPDTLQLNYANPATQEALIGELRRMSGQCDGLRCDMAMLVLPDVFQRTWGVRPELFWPRATQRVRELVPKFCFMAEVYWDLEYTLQQQGFDYAYDKRLYDRLRDGHAKPVREHFWAGLDYQNKLARFLENHDEPRAAATLPPPVHKAAAVITYLSQGLRFFHQGQFEGKRKHISPHLVRGPVEPVDEELKQFYDQLLPLVRESVVREGQWRSLECAAAWDGNWTNECFIAFAWDGPAGQRRLVIVNYADNRSQCNVRLPFGDLGGKTWRLQDCLDKESYDRSGDNLQSQGLFIDLDKWHYNIFDMASVS
jgi:hypothetical protein